MSRFNAGHNESHWVAVKRILRYLKGTIDYRLRYKKNEEDLQTYTDSDWGSCIDDRKSRSGYTLLLSGAAITWESKKQNIVALSSAEAEYIALSSATREVIWTIQLLDELNERPSKPVTIWCDNTSALDLASSEAYRPRTKHIDIRFHHLRDQIVKGVIQPMHVVTEKQVADSLTKAVTGEKTKFCATGMGLHQTG